MDGLHELRLRAERSRRSGYAAPVVTSVDEAKALAAQVVDQIAGLPDRERLLVLAHLDDVCGVIQARLERLQVEIVESRQQIVAANEGGAACTSYATAKGLAAPGRPKAAR
jgi:hypothetical protein